MSPSRNGQGGQNAHLVDHPKSALQALGIGLDLAFPGEPDGPKHRLLLLEPRKFSALIWQGSRAGLFQALISFSGGAEELHRSPAGRAGAAGTAKHGAAP